ncbi:MAG: Holliday junction resolvase RuvX [Alphaproteobacteria bacterium]
MAIRNIRALELEPGRRLIGLDVGEKTIGVAVSDPGRELAMPQTTIRRSKFARDAKALEALYAETKAGAFIIGLPMNMDGSEGPRCQSVRQFAANLLEAFEAKIAFWDERLSTVAVTRRMIEADLSRRRRAEIVDRAAAAYILQGALDFLGKETPPPAGMS